MILLDGLRVLDLSTEIAGPYCTKLLADAGADVVKIESGSGDPLRAWSASGVDLGGREGALFQFLNGSKRSVAGGLRSREVADLVAGADLLIESGSLSAEDMAWLSSTSGHLSVVSITPFGRTGPWKDRPWTEFVLQALCGSIAGRGTLEREPFYAGGRLGEWIAGAFAAVAGMAAVQGTRHHAAGERVDLSMLECMAICMGGSAGLRASLSDSGDNATPPRTIETPSIEPTADGFVGLCTVTAQQFSDLLVLIERPDLAADTDLANSAGRYARRQEFLSVVWKWTTKRTTAEIEELAARLRIPVAPIGRPETITQLAQFVERGVYVSNPAGFVQPRIPYRVDDRSPVGPKPAPSLGQHTGSVHWPPRPPVAGGGDEVHEGALPLAGLRIIDLTAFWAGPVATLVLAALGAEVIKVESVQRPDPMRFTSAKKPGDPGWWEWGSVYLGNNFNKKGITLDLGQSDGRAILIRLLGQADALIENFSPRVLDKFGITWEGLKELNPRLIMVRMPAFGLSGPWKDRTGFAQTMEQVSGMAWMTGFRDGPPIIPRGPCDPLAGVHAAFVLLACLEERRRSGEGHFVESTMVESALNVAAEMVIESSAYGATLKRDGNRGPVGAPQGVYRCKDSNGHEEWLAVAITDDGQWKSFCEAIGKPAWAEGHPWQHAPGRREAAELIDAEIEAWCADRDVDGAVSELLARGIPAAEVTEPARVSSNTQMRFRGFIESFDHVLAGRHETVGMPFRFGSQSGPWFQSASPTLGQHNRDVLEGILGMTDADLSRLTAASVIGDRPR